MLVPLRLNLPGTVDNTLFCTMSMTATMVPALTTTIEMAALFTGSGDFLADLFTGPPPETPVAGVWPASLPVDFLQGGFKESQPAGAALRSNVDSGPAKQRRRYSALNLPFTGVMSMNSAQLDDFWLFYRETLGNGALVFEGLPHMRTKAAVRHRFNVSSPPEDMADGGDSYLVSMTLEIVP